jgi:hypothetical protein
MPHFWEGRHGEGQAHPPVISAAVFIVPKGSRGLDVVSGVLDVLITQMISRRLTKSPLRFKMRGGKGEFGSI